MISRLSARPTKKHCGRASFIPRWPKLPEILSWEDFPAAVVVADQADLRASDACRSKASGCPPASFPLFSGCDVAVCVHVSVEEDNPSPAAREAALARTVPALLAARI